MGGGDRWVGGIIKTFVTQTPIIGGGICSGAQTHAFVVVLR